MKKVCFHIKKISQMQKMICLQMQKPHCKQPRQIPAANSHDKFLREIVTAKTHGKLLWQIPTANSREKFPQHFLGYVM